MPSSNTRQVGMSSTITKIGRGDGIITRQVGAIPELGRYKGGLITRLVRVVSLL